MRIAAPMHTRTSTGRTAAATRPTHKNTAARIAAPMHTRTSPDRPPHRIVRLTGARL